MIQSSRLSFNIYDTGDCKSFGILDTSYYSTVQTLSNPTLQIVSPFDDTPVELNFYRNAITTINSNSIKITNVSDYDYLTILPDGIYIAKITMCPIDQFWYEKTWYRTCQLECKYDLAFLKLNINVCESCFSPEKLERLERARIYIYGVKTNAKSCNYKEANKLYKAAAKILDNIINCDNCK